MTHTKYIIPADRSPESILNVISILFIDSNVRFGALKTRHLILEGTIEERLQQYKEASGEDWKGIGEKVFSTSNYNEPSVSLNLGKPEHRALHPVDRRIQDEVDRLSLLAKEYLEENEVAKRKKKVMRLIPETSGV